MSRDSRERDRVVDWDRDINFLPTSLVAFRQVHEKYRETSSIISRLEGQVKSMRQSQSAKEGKLTQERERAVNAARYSDCRW